GQVVRSLPAIPGTRGVTYVPSRNELCQSYRDPDTLVLFREAGLICVDPQTGAQVDRLTDHTTPGTFGLFSPAAVASRADDDTFYVLDSLQETISRVNGSTHADPGAIVKTCQSPGILRSITYSASQRLLWLSGSEQVQPYDLETCAPVRPPLDLSST